MRRASVGIGKTYAYLDRLHFTEKVCPGWTCRFSAGGDFYLQRCLTGLPSSKNRFRFYPGIFLENRVISKPIRAIVEEKEKSVLSVTPGFLKDWKRSKIRIRMPKQLKALLSLRTYYDLDSVTGLSVDLTVGRCASPKVCEKTLFAAPAGIINT